MSKYYEEYKSLHEEVKKAVDCPKCSLLKDKVDAIFKNLQGLNLDWNDDVRSEFDNYILACESILKTISSSISFDFQSAENSYNHLKTILDNFEKDDETYDTLLKNKPSETITSTLKDGTTTTITSPRYIEWKRKKGDLEQAFNNYSLEIQPYKRILLEVGGKTIATALVNVGIQSAGTPVFTMPDIQNTDTDIYSSNLEQYLSSISNDPSKCEKVIDLRPVIDEIGTTSQHTFMGWQKVTNKDSTQYLLRKTAYPNYNKNSSDYYDSEGFAKIGDRYVVATTTTYGNVGDYIDIEQADGSVIKAIIGDIKSQEVVAWDKNPANKWGHNGGKCVVEFVVDCNSWYNDSWSKGAHDNPGTSSCHPEWHQDVVEVRNLGSYFDINDRYVNI